MWIREATTEDDLDALLSGTICWPGSEQIRGFFAAASDSASAQLVAIENGLVGYAHCLTTPVRDGGRADVHVWVDPPSRGRGIGGALWTEVIGVARRAGLPGVQAIADVDDKRSVVIAETHGLDRGPVNRESRLDLVTLSPRVIEEAVSQATRVGVVVEPFDSAEDRAWRQLYANFVPLHNATPDGLAGREPPPYEVWRSGYIEPWQVLVARRDGVIVGMTLAFERTDLPSRVVTRFTGVRADERGNGIATALKAEHARRLRDAGWRELSTWNREENTPILAVNARLGFAPITRVLMLTLDFDHPTDLASSPTTSRSPL